MLIALILFSVTIAAVAQLTLKHGMNQVTASSGALRTPTILSAACPSGFTATSVG